MSKNTAARIITFVLWPVIAPLMAVFIILLLAALWFAIPFVDLEKKE